jgi:hypothetical protein
MIPYQDFWIPSQTLPKWDVMVIPDWLTGTLFSCISLSTQDKLGEDSVYDIEHIAQITKVSQSISRKKLKDLTDEEVYKAEKAAAEGDINVGANLNALEAIEAQEILHKGGVELSMSSTFLVHRYTVEELDRACDYLKSLFLYLFLDEAAALLKFPALALTRSASCWQSRLGLLQLVDVRWTKFYLGEDLC